MKFMSVPVLTLVAALGVTACSTNSYAPKPKPHFAFDQQAPIKLDASSILFQNHYTPSSEPNAFEQDFPVTLSQSIGHWINNRLVAAGDMGGDVIFTIDEASVVKTDLETTPGLQGLLTIDQSEKYTAKIAVTIEAKGVPAGNQAGTITAQRSITVAENATLAQRETAWAKLTQAIMEDFNGSAERFFNNNMAGIVLNNQ